MRRPLRAEGRKTDGRGRRLEVESAARALLYSCCFLRWSLSLAHHPLRRLPRSLPLLPSFLTSFARRGEARRCDLAVLGLARSRPHTAFGFAFDDATAKQEFLSSADLHALSLARDPLSKKLICAQELILLT